MTFEYKCQKFPSNNIVNILIDFFECLLACGYVTGT